MIRHFTRCCLRHWLQGGYRTALRNLHHRLVIERYGCDPRSWADHVCVYWSLWLLIDKVDYYQDRLASEGFALPRDCSWLVRAIDELGEGLGRRGE